MTLTDDLLRTALSTENGALAYDAAWLADANDPLNRRVCLATALATVTRDVAQCAAALEDGAPSAALAERAALLATLGARIARALASESGARSARCSRRGGR